MTRSIHHYRVEICKYANYGTGSESFEVVKHRNLKYDRLTIDLKEPKFSFVLSNERGINRRKWKESDIVKIYKDNAVVFLGSINSSSPRKNATTAELQISGIHFYYRRVIDTYMTTPGIASLWNPFRFGRKSKQDGTDIGEALDGLNPADIIKAVTGHELIIQEFFDNMDNLDNAAWLKNPNAFTDLTSNIANPDMELNTSWTYDETDNVTYGTPSTFADGNYSGTLVRNGTQAYNISHSDTVTELTTGDGAMIYQDGVTISPGDVIHSFIAATNSGTDGPENAKFFSAKMLIFKDNTFDHPFDGDTQKAMVAGVRVGGSMSTTFQPIGGVVNVQETGTYRVAIQVFYDGLGQVLTSTHNFYIDDVTMSRNNIFNGVSLQEDKLQLKQLSFEEGNEKFMKAGNAETVDYYVGNPNVKILPKLKGTATAVLVGEPYQSDPDIEFIFKEHVYGAPDNVQPPVSATLLSTAVLDNLGISAADASQDSFTVDGDRRVDFRTGRKFNVTGSTGNNGAYTTAYTEYSNATEQTTIYVSDADDVTSSVGDGDIDFTIPLQRWTYSIPVPADVDKFRLKINLSGDGNGTSKIDYLRVSVPTDSITREITYTDPDDPLQTTSSQLYREDITGISPDLSNVDNYVFPATLFPDATATYDTFTAEFANEPVMRALSEILSNTVKSPILDNTTLPNLPVGKELVVRDPNWDMQIDNNGVLHFKEHIGQYYGKLAPKNVRKEYSFRKKNLTLIDTTEEGNDIINNLTYIAEGVNGINNLILDGDPWIDPVSVAKYGMRQGHISEKKTFDVGVATSRAFAILREKSSPILKIKVDLMPGFEDEWNVGDIIYVRDLDEELDDDFRVLEMNVHVDDNGGEKVNVTLSTKNKTLDSFKSTLEKQIATLNTGKQGSGAIATQGGQPEVISRDIPYVVAVDIPRDAEKNLQRVTLDMLTKPVFSTQTLLSAVGHTHDVTIPGHSHSISIPNHTHPVSLDGLTLEVNGDTPESNATATAKPTDTDTATNPLLNPEFIDSVNFSNLTNAAPGLHQGTTRNFSMSNVEFMEFHIDWVANSGNDDWQLAVWAEFDTGDVVLMTDFTANWNAGYVQHRRVTLDLDTITADLTSTPSTFEHIDIVVQKVGTTQEDIFVRCETFIYGVHKHGFTGTNGNHTHPVTVTGSVTSGQATNGGAATITPSVSSSVQAISGGGHTHESLFQLNHNRNANNELLFPTNLNVSLNDVQGIGNVATGFNAGPMPELAGLASSETGDLTNSQALGIGFSLDRQDISHAFKDADGKWLIGRHFLTIRAPGNDNQVNAENLGVLSAKVNLDRMTDFHREIV